MWSGRHLVNIIKKLIDEKLFSNIFLVFIHADPATFNAKIGRWTIVWHRNGPSFLKNHKNMSWQIQFNFWNHHLLFISLCACQKFKKIENFRFRVLNTQIQADIFYVRGHFTVCWIYRVVELGPAAWPTFWLKNGF